MLKPHSKPGQINLKSYSSKRSEQKLQNKISTLNIEELSLDPSRQDTLLFLVGISTILDNKEENPTCSQYSRQAEARWSYFDCVSVILQCPAGRDRVHPAAVLGDVPGLWGSSTTCSSVPAALLGAHSSAQNANSLLRPTEMQLKTHAGHTGQISLKESYCCYSS